MPTPKFTVLTLPNLRRLLKGLAYLVAGLCGFGAVFVVLLILINLPAFDEDLHPDLAALVTPAALPRDKGNAYAGLMGLRASPGQDFVATGQALMQRQLDNHAGGNDGLSEADYDELLGPDPLTTGLLPEETCRTPTTACSLQQLSTMLQQGDYDRARMELVLQRYAALLALQVMEPTINATFKTAAPNYQAARDAQKYALAASYNTGSSAAFLAQVAADLQFWRLLVQDGPWLIDKMVAIAAVWTDMQMLSEYMASHELSADDRALVASFLVPLTADEIDISEAFFAEAMLTHSTLEYLHAFPESASVIIPSRLKLQLTLTNATTNQNYVQYIQPLIAMSKLPAADFAKAITTPEFEAELQRRSSVGTVRRSLGLSPRNLYNLGGKLLLGEGIYPSAHTYIGRMHDINAMMLAVQLQFELEGMVPEQRLEALRGRFEALRAEGAAPEFSYDAAAGKLSFQCFDPPTRSAERCGVQL
jgi:hypothetical protein